VRGFGNFALTFAPTLSGLLLDLCTSLQVSINPPQDLSPLVKAQSGGGAIFDGLGCDELRCWRCFGWGNSIGGPWESNSRGIVYGRWKNRSGLIRDFCGGLKSVRSVAVY